MIEGRSRITVSICQTLKYTSILECANYYSLIALLFYKLLISEYIQLYFSLKMRNTNFITLNSSQYILIHLFSNNNF